MKAKVDRLEADVKEIEHSMVSKELFEADIDHLRHDVHEMQRDIKKILFIMTKIEGGSQIGNND